MNTFERSQQPSSAAVDCIFIYTILLAEFWREHGKELLPKLFSQVCSPSSIQKDHLLHTHTAQATFHISVLDSVSSPCGRR